MGRKHRIDEPGTWHHVMNRGVAKRTMFESDCDARRFFERLGVAAERAGVQVHSYALMLNHFHMLVRSLDGSLSKALHLIQAPFGQWFNRTRDRDGPIHRSRFHSIRVRSLRYRRLLVRYIDTNPVVGGLATNAVSYRHGSAYHYAFRGGPAWLTRDWVESEVSLVARSKAYDPAHYERAFPPRLMPEQRAILSGSSRSRQEAADSLDQLLSLSVEGWDSWIAARAHAADGTARLPTLVPHATIARVAAGSPATLDEAPCSSPIRSTSTQLHVALARLLTGATFDEVAAHLGLSNRTVRRIWKRAIERRANDAEFASRLGQLGNEALTTFWTDD